MNWEKIPIPRILIIMLMIGIIFGSAGCQSLSTGDNEKQKVQNEHIKITVILPEHEMDTIGFHKEQTRRFERETGIEVELINMGWDQIADRLTADLTAGDSSFDVIELDNAWVEKFVNNDWLEPLDAYVSKEIMDGMLPSLIEKFSKDGKLYGITWNNDTRFYMYNKEKLNEAGIEKVPETWEEVVAATKLMQQQGLIKYGFIDCYHQEWAGANELMVMVHSWGGRLIDENGQPVMATDPKTKTAYEFLVYCIKEGIADPSSLTSNQETISNIFCMGDTAFFLQAWPGVYNAANDINTSDIVGEIAVADYAIHAEGEEPLILTVPEAMAIPKSSKNKEAAWKYIEFMSSRELDKERAKKLGTLPIWSDLFQDPELLEKYPYWINFGKQIEYAQGLPNVEWYDEFVNILTAESQKIILEEVSVEEGLRSIQQQCEAVMQDYK